MRDSQNLKIGALFLLAALAVVAGGIVSCGTAPTPFVVSGPGQVGNDRPTLDIIEPNASITRSQGDPFVIRWQDNDSDNNAQISFSLVETGSNVSLLLVAGVDEDDASGPSSLTVETTLIPIGTYNLLGVIDDGVNAPVEAAATVTAAAVTQRVVITIVGPGEGPQTVPPVITVTEPSFNLSVAQDDVLIVSVQPTDLLPDPARPFDPDSTLRLFILLDFDTDPNNDDPADPDPSKIIVLEDQTLQPMQFEAVVFAIPIDLAVIPPRPSGEPYFIRATVDDATNPRVHRYAVGTISVVQLAAGTVDLFDIGRVKSGVKFQGFNPGAMLGSSITNLTDFDADGVDDFLVVAQFGNPQNVGPVGEAYLVYGQAAARFGGTIPVNSISNTVSGVIFQAPPVRGFLIPSPTARTDGITDASFIRDLTADGRPELLFGLPHVHGAFDSMDFDPSDEQVSGGTPLGCFPDLLVNNITDTDQVDPFDVQWYAGGMAIMINSQNRDNNPVFTPPPVRLDTTAVSLELAGQDGAFVLDTVGIDLNGGIFARADNGGLPQGPAGSDPDEAGRIAGARFVAGLFDFEDPFGLGQPPREGLFGRRVGSLGDLNSDGLDEIIISAPRNERYLADVSAEFPFPSTHSNSTPFRGSIIVLPGSNYNLPIWRDVNDDNGTAQVPSLDQQTHPAFGSCTGNPRARHLDTPADAFEIFAEDLDDFLGGAGSAGDVNQDGLDDILCGAPKNDRTNSLPDSGAVYVIYGRNVFGPVRLRNADSTTLRTPMLRIRGERRGDQIGWEQTAGLDVNGDRIDDVFFGSPHTDFGGVLRETCGSPTNLGLGAFDSCEARVGGEVFSDDACKVFDYDNDGDIDDEDRCIFCCQSSDCTPASTCVMGLNSADCCEDLVDNGFIGIVFGGVSIDGDRTLDQLATSQLPGVVFYGTTAGDRAGFDVSSAGDFNQDGFGDILIAAPGETRCDRDVPPGDTCSDVGRERLGVVYLIFGGTHLINTTWNLSSVGSDELPGIIFLSPYVKGAPNEAAPTTVAFIGDINDDGFGDIAIGNPKADFIDSSFPQGPNAPGADASAGRRTNVGDAYVIYGNNFGTNRAVP